MFFRHWVAIKLECFGDGTTVSIDARRLGYSPGKDPWFQFKNSNLQPIQDITIVNASVKIFVICIIVMFFFLE